MRVAVLRRDIEPADGIETRAGVRIHEEREPSANPTGDPAGVQRVDVGLRVQAPAYVSRLVERWCHAPSVLDPVLTRPVEAPNYVTLRFWRATFAPDGPGWIREELGRHPVVYDCASEAVPVFPQVSGLIRE